MIGALGGCGASAGAADGGGTGGGAGSGGPGGSSGGAGSGGVGAGGGGGSSGGADGAVVDGGDPCASLAGQGFLSVDELPCNGGINPQAPPCRWSVAFPTAQDFSYAMAGGDVEIAGTYVCAGGTITGTARDFAMVYHGTYGGPGSQLIWDGHPYQP